MLFCFTLLFTLAILEEIENRGGINVIEIGREHVIGELSDLNPAVQCCQNGDTVVFHTRDCYDDSVVSESSDPLARKFANPATGPLYVNGAVKGDILKVEILDIEVASTGVMRTSVTDGGLSGIIQKKEVRIFSIEKGFIAFDSKLSLAIDPMIGVIGTTPENGKSVGTETPGEHGGNMDCRLIRKGSTLYLPVNYDGALLAMGDLHALMADGEVMICGMECRGKVTLTVQVIKAVKLPTPFLLDEGFVMTIQSALTLDAAARLASEKMHTFIMEACAVSINKAAMLMSLLSHMTICQVVDPLKTVRMSFPLAVLQEYGFRLP